MLGLFAFTARIFAIIFRYSGHHHLTEHSTLSSLVGERKCSMVRGHQHQISYTWAVDSLWIGCTATPHSQPFGGTSGALQPTDHFSTGAMPESGRPNACGCPFCCSFLAAPDWLAHRLRNPDDSTAKISISWGMHRVSGAFSGGIVPTGC